MDPAVLVSDFIRYGAVALDASLWLLAFMLVVSPEARFRLLAAAALVLYVVLVLFLGIGLASAIWFGGLWVFGIVASLRGSEAGMT
jgi:hypothetical protein